MLSSLVHVCISGVGVASLKFRSAQDIYIAYLRQMQKNHRLDEYSEIPGQSKTKMLKSCLLLCINTNCVT